MNKQILVKVAPPMTPNFIIVGKTPVAIEDFTNEELREIGQEWVNDLIEKAKSRRKPHA